MKKGAIGLSINMLVVIIISITVMVSGIAFTYNLISKSDTLEKQLNDQSKAQIERLLVNQGAQVALPLQRITLKRGKEHLFGMGIRNIEESKNFYVTITLAQFVDLEGKIVDEDKRKDGKIEVDILNTLVYNSEGIHIKENEHKVQSILVNIPKEFDPGTYVFKVTVSKGIKGVTQYGNPQRIYVTAI